MKKRLVFAIVLLCVLSFAGGYSLGVKNTIDYGIDVILKLMEKDKITFEIDEQMIKDGIFQYRERLNSCLFLEGQNASILYD